MLGSVLKHVILMQMLSLGVVASGTSPACEAFDEHHDLFYEISM